MQYLGVINIMRTITNFLSSVLGFFYELTFGCRHNRQTRPFTLESETYKVCLDCGRQIFYSSERMTPLTGREVRRMKAAQAEAGVLVHRAPHTMPTAAAERKVLAERGRKTTAAA
jgi:hypothetical protein